MNYSKSLVEHLINTKVLFSSKIIEAFRHVDRADFVYDAYSSDVYGDYPLPIGYNQTISQPTTVAMMLEMLEPKKGQKILDIGSGSGWTTALLAYIAGDDGSVIGLERVPELVSFGRENLSKYGFKNAKILQATRELGLVGEKFDRILVSAAAGTFAYELAEQLKNGGKLVMPIGNSIYEVTKDTKGELQALVHYGFTFVPLIK